MSELTLAVLSASLGWNVAYLSQHFTESMESELAAAIAIGGGQLTWFLCLMVATTSIIRWLF